MNIDNMARFNTYLNLPEIYFIRSIKETKNKLEFSYIVGVVNSITLCEKKCDIIDADARMDFSIVCNFEI